MGKTTDLFKTIRDTKGTFHVKIGIIKDRNSKQSREAEEIQEEVARIQRTVQKGLNDRVNHDGAITHLQPDLMECEVKWVLGSITTNKARTGDRIPAELFHTPKDDAVKYCTQYVNKF